MILRQKAIQNYDKAKETEKNFDELSPSEKAMHLLDSIISTIEKFGINNESIREKALELKKLLVDILNIATAPVSYTHLTLPTKA